MKRTISLLALAAFLLFSIAAQAQDQSVRVAPDSEALSISPMIEAPLTRHVPIGWQLAVPTQPLASTSVFKTEAARWAAFGANVKVALATDSDGLQQGALRQIIRHGEALRLDRRTAFEVMRIYRGHENDDMRRMAVVALGAMHDGWAIGFLARSISFEKTPRVRQTMKAVVAAYRAPQPEATLVGEEAPLARDGF